MADVPAEAVDATLTLSSSVSADPSPYTMILPNNAQFSVDWDLDYSYFGPFTIPTAPTRVVAPSPAPGTPEIATTADPTLNTYITIRPLWGVIVDMDDPVIEDGKPT